MEVSSASLEKLFMTRISSSMPTTQSNIYVFEMITFCQLGPKKKEIYFPVM